jgi:hypothetical protein
MASCVTPPPPMGPPFGPPQPPNFGFQGTRSPNYPAEQRSPTGQTPPKIVRDPRDTTIDVTPPEPRNKPTDVPPSTSNPTEPPPLSSETTQPKPPAPVRDDLPYGIPVVGKKGMVYSPFAPEKGQVDVEGYKRGTRVECPYTGKHFRVP